MGLPKSGPCALSARRDVTRIVALFKASYFCKGKKADVEAITVILYSPAENCLYSLSLLYLYAANKLSFFRLCRTFSDTDIVSLTLTQGI